MTDDDRIETALHEIRESFGEKVSMTLHLSPGTALVIAALCVHPNAISANSDNSYRRYWRYWHLVREG